MVRKKVIKYIHASCVHVFLHSQKILLLRKRSSIKCLRSCLYGRRDGTFCRDGTFAGTFFIPALKTVYMEAERDIFYPGFKNCLYGRRDGMFAGTGRFIPGLHVSTGTISPGTIFKVSIISSGKVGRSVYMIKIVSL